jgi:hypothetical protein
MKDELEQAFAELLARNPGADGRGDYYGIEIENIAPEGSESDLILVFRSGESYCCAEPGCRLAYDEPGWWETLRRIMDDHETGDLPPLTIQRIRGIVEGNVRLRCHSSFGLSAVSAGYCYESGPHAEVVSADT